MMTVLLGVPVLLMAWGSLRYTLTPLGYWLAWGLWAGVVVIDAWLGRASNGWVWPTAWVAGSFGLLALGMVVASGINQDGVALYQAAKILVIGILCWIMWQLAARADAESLLRVLYGALALVTLVFFLSKAFSSASYNLGGSREGDIFARAGVLWKAGLFFLPLCVADWLCNPRRWVAAACAIGACLFLVVIDGSRTGLLLIVVISLGFGAVLWGRGGLACSPASALDLAVGGGGLVGAVAAQRRHERLEIRAVSTGQCHRVGIVPGRGPGEPGHRPRGRQPPGQRRCPSASPAAQRPGKVPRMLPPGMRFRFDRDRRGLWHSHERAQRLPGGFGGLRPIGLAGHAGVRRRVGLAAAGAVGPLGRSGTGVFHPGDGGIGAGLLCRTGSAYLQYGNVRMGLSAADAGLCLATGPGA